MKVTLKVKNKETGRFRFVRCKCCNEKRKFPSFKQAARYAAVMGHECSIADRVLG